MSKVIPIADYYTALARNMRFTRENFRALAGGQNPEHGPHAEMLARHPNGQSAGTFFDEARASGRVISTDLIVFRRAIEKQQITGDRVSINLNAETVFSREFKAELLKILNQFPLFDPTQVCLEVTEQGGIPNSFNEEILVYLQGMGFGLAMDDYNPFDPNEQCRLELLAPYMNIVKFPHEIMGVIRGTDSPVVDALTLQMRAVKYNYPHITLVLEGVRESDRRLYPLLAEMGIDVIQESSFGALDESVPAELAYTT